MVEVNKKDLAVIHELEKLIGKRISRIEGRELHEYEVSYRTDDEGRIVGLSLLNYGIKDLSPIFQLKNLTELYLPWNQLISLPEWIGELKNLTKLNLWGDRLTSMPKGTKELKNLTKLDLSENRMTNVSEEIRQLKNLTELDLGGNRLTRIPEWIGELKNLTMLSFTNNQLTSIPEGIKELRNLTALYFGHNQLTSVPDGIKELKNLKELSFSSNQQISIPQGIRELKNLTRFDLSDNQLTNVPEWIRELKNLTRLDLSGNQLTNVPEWIRELNNLRELNLRGNRLTSVPERIKELENLTALYLGDNQLTSVPDWIGELKNLTTLSLGGNQLTSVPEGIKELENLTELWLGGNQLTSVPDWIGKLKNLTELTLYNNQLTSVPDGIRELKNLRRLHLFKNLIRELPEFILELGLEIVCNADKSVNDRGFVLGDNPLEIPPVEVVKQGNEAIRQYFAAMKKAKETLNEAKILLVGDGGAGKTSVVRQIFGEKFDKNESQTQGIVIRKKSYRISKRNIKAHFWDFGGQVIMHATHQFFLSERSLYILLLDGRKEEDAEYWLQLIESFGGKSPILVVMNKIDDNRAFEVNRRFLQDKYKGIVGFYRVSCKEDEGFGGKDGLIGGIKTAIEKVEMLRSEWPKSWIRAKEQLEAMKGNQKHFISALDYQRLCERAGISDEGEQETLVGYLHDLGLILHFPGLNLADMHVLEPHWVTDAVYRIINSKKLAEKHGELHENDLNNILKKRKTDDYSYAGKYGYIIELMRKFELCFSYPDSDGHYLIPELLDKQQPPEADNFKAQECLNFSYCYPILPEGLLPRFIVRTHVLSRNTPRWRTGVVLTLEDNKALVVADVKARRVFVRVKGPVPGRQRLLAVIRSDFEHIHSNFTFQPEEIVSAPKYSEVSVSYQKLLVLEKNGFKFFQEVFNGKLLDLDVEEMLNGIDIQGSRKSDKETERKPLRLFYSYSHKDEELRNELETHLKILKRTGIIEDWHDRKITAGQEWKGKIDENLEKADVILLLVSSDFIASDYCWDVEMKRAMERHEAKEARVIPVVIRDVNWTKAPFAKLQALPKDAKAVTTWPNKDTAWRDVSEGIEKVAAEMVKR